VKGRLRALGALCADGFPTGGTEVRRSSGSVVAEICALSKHEKKSDAACVESATGLDLLS
jgi:hypothetical protein